MAAISDLVPLLASHSAGVAEPVLINIIRRAANRFCIESGVWRETLESPFLQNGAYIVELDLPAQSKLVAILDCELNGVPLSLAGDELTMPPEPASRPKQVYGEVGSAYLDGYLATGDVMTVRVSLAPSYLATTLPDYLLHDWQEAIIAGTLSELFVYPGNAQYDPRLAQYWKEQFAGWVLQGRARARSGRNHAVRRVRYGGI